MEFESHVILKQYSRLESEIENLDITNELKRETKDLIKGKIISEINLTNARAMESIANAKFTNENIKTIGAYRDWETDRKSTRLNSSHRSLARMPSSA